MTSKSGEQMAEEVYYQMKYPTVQENVKVIATALRQARIEQKNEDAKELQAIHRLRGEA